MFSAYYKKTLTGSSVVFLMIVLGIIFNFIPHTFGVLNVDHYANDIILEFSRLQLYDWAISPFGVGTKILRPVSKYSNEYMFISNYLLWTTSFFISTLLIGLIVELTKSVKYVKKHFITLGISATLVILIIQTVYRLELEPIRDMPVISGYNLFDLTSISLYIFIIMGAALLIYTNILFNRADRDTLLNFGLIIISVIYFLVYAATDLVAYLSFFSMLGFTITTYSNNKKHPIVSKEIRGYKRNYLKLEEL